MPAVSDDMSKRILNEFCFVHQGSANETTKKTENQASHVWLCWQHGEKDEIVHAPNYTVLAGGGFKRPK